MSTTNTSTGITEKINIIKGSELISKSKEEIYKTTYKKGPIMGSFHFSHEGGLIEAVSSVKEYLKKKNLKHIHTVPFLVDLNKDNFEEIAL